MLVIGRSKGTDVNAVARDVVSEAEVVTLAPRYLLAGALEMGHARALLALPTAQQAGAATRVVNQRLSVRETERLVHALQGGGKARAAHARRTHDTDTARLETELAEALGAKVRIDARRNGAGRLVISYASLTELDAIVARLR